MQIDEQTDRLRQATKRRYTETRAEPYAFKQGFFQEEARVLSADLPMARVASNPVGVSSSVASTSAQALPRAQRLIVTEARPEPPATFLPPSPMRKFKKTQFFLLKIL